MIEPRDNPARYDQEFFLALHDWGGYLLASDDGAMNPSYAVATINGKALGFGEPLRVKQGQRILLHVLNSSPTEVHWMALAGHQPARGGARWQSGAGSSRGAHAAARAG